MQTGPQGKMIQAILYLMFLFPNILSWESRYANTHSKLNFKFANVVVRDKFLSNIFIYISFLPMCRIKTTPSIKEKLVSEYSYNHMMPVCIFSIHVVLFCLSLMYVGQS